jgi:hypothetical protein
MLLLALLIGRMIQPLVKIYNSDGWESRDFFCTCRFHAIRFYHNKWEGEI